MLTDKLIWRILAETQFRMFCVPIKKKQIRGRVKWKPEIFFIFFIMDDMVCWSVTHTRFAVISFTVTRRFSFTVASTTAMASVVTTRCVWPGRGDSLTELMPLMNFLVHSYTFCSDRHASPYWTFIRRWISMGFTPSLLKNRMTERCSFLVHVASGAAIFTPLLRRLIEFLHRTATCRPLFKPWAWFLSTYKTSKACFEFLSHL